MSQSIFNVDELVSEQVITLLSLLTHQLCNLVSFVLDDQPEEVEELLSCRNTDSLSLLLVEEQIRDGDRKAMTLTQVSEVV